MILINLVMINTVFVSKHFNQLKIKLFTNAWHTQNLNTFGLMAMNQRNI